MTDRLTSIQHARDVTALFDVENGYDAVGNRLFTRNSTPGLEDRSELYDYDQRHRLRRMNRGIIAGGGAPVLVSPIADNDLAAAQDWTVLDRRGNWSEFAETIGVTPVTTTQTRMRNGVNEYQAIDPDGPGPQPPVALTHDANGNVTLDPTARNLGDGQAGVPDPSGHLYEYDEENRLTTVRRASDNALLLSISYDAIGRRVASADYLAAGDPCGGPPALTRHIYAALEALEEHLSCDGGTNYALAREFIWGDRFPQPVALITHGGVSGGFGGSSVPAGESVSHYLHDVLGSVVALTNASGQVVERYTYDAYGKTFVEETNPATGLPTARLEASAFGNPFAWTGQRYDAGVRLYHFLYRGYSPSLGRWLQRDPVGYVDGASLYEYVRSRPHILLDPLGLFFGRSCEKIMSDILKTLKDAKNEQRKWDEQRKNPPQGTNYPSGCIDRGHQEEQENRFKRLRKLLNEYEKNNCWKRYPKTNPWEWYERLIREWHKIPKEPLAPKPVPRWVIIMDDVVPEDKVDDVIIWTWVGAGGVVCGGAIIIYGPALIPVVAPAAPALAF